MKIIGLDAMKEEAARFVANLQGREGASVVALSGELGAGKTSFAQGIAAALGVGEAVTSPTFVIEKAYDLPAGRQGWKQKFSRLIHIDAYRLKDSHELEVLGWNEIVNEPSNLVIIEWPERVAALIPDHAMRISFSGSGDSREIQYNQ